MKARSVFLLSLAIACSLLLSGCQSTPQAAKPPTAAATAAKPKKKPTTPVGQDRYEDASFQSFIVRLRQAVHEHDLNTVASLMTKDFGYRLEPPGEGEGVFKYWDDNNLWPELELVVGEHFVPNQEYMVAPEEFITNPANYNGYRAGIRQENGGWKFAYFVAGS